MSEGMKVHLRSLIAGALLGSVITGTCVDGIRAQQLERSMAMTDEAIRKVEAANRVFDLSSANFEECMRRYDAAQRDISKCYLGGAP